MKYLVLKYLPGSDESYSGPCDLTPYKNSLGFFF